MERGEAENKEMVRWKMRERISMIEYYLVACVLLFGGFVMRVSWRRRIGRRMFHIMIVIGTVIMVKIRITVVMAGS